MDWIKWALGEAALRTTSITLLKTIGGLATTMGQLTASTLVIGVVQVLVPGAIVWYHRIPLVSSRRQVVGSIAFGAGAFVGTMLPFVAFMLGADLATYTFLALLAIVPGALIDRVFFEERLVTRQVAGILLAVLAGWLVLKTPNLTELAMLPLWAWLALLNACSLAINQGVTRWVKEVNVWVKNVWGGATTALLCLLTFAVLGEEGRVLLSTPDLPQLLGWSVVIGFVVIGLWSFNVLAYRSGAAIPTKNVAVNGVYLFASMIVGYLFFSEAISPVQILGIVVYIGAFILINNAVWVYLTEKKA